MNEEIKVIYRPIKEDASEAERGLDRAFDLLFEEMVRIRGEPGKGRVGVERITELGHEG